MKKTEKSLESAIHIDKKDSCFLRAESSSFTIMSYFRSSYTATDG